jgi:uncharacterized membrane protein
MMRSQPYRNIGSLSISPREETISGSFNTFIKGMPYTFVLFCTLLAIVMFALGFVVGYLTFKPSSTTTIPPSTSTTALTSPSTTITTSSQSTIMTATSSPTS